MINETIIYLQESYSLNPIAQIWWRVATIPLILAVMTKNDHRLRLIFVFWWGLRIIHFFLLGTFAAMVAIIIATIRIIASIIYNWNWRVMYFFMILFLIACFLTYENIFSTFPMIAWLIATYAFFKLSWIKMRVSFLLCSWLWLAYSIFNHSIWWIITEIIIEISFIITIIRIFNDGKEERIKSLHI